MLENIDIDVGGVCESCTYIDISDAQLERLKIKTLKKIEKF